MYNFKLHDPLFLPHIGCEIELNLPPGGGIVLVGENGVGKTTLLHRLATQIQNSALIEQAALEFFYDRSLGKFQELFLSSAAASLDEKFFLAAWNDFRLSEKHDRPLSSLSGGESQSLKLALGLCQNSSVFFMDEPSQFLDKELKAVLGHKIAALLERKKSVLIVEHDYEWLKVPASFSELGVLEGSLRKVRTWTT